MSNFKTYASEFNELGEVIAVFYPVVVISGLPSVRPKEIVIFENNVRAQVLRVGRDTAEVLLLSNHPIRVGTSLTRTGKQMAVPVGDYLLGMVVDPLGVPLLASEGFEKDLDLTTEQDSGYLERIILEQAAEVRDIDIPAPSINRRVPIRRQLLTGVSVVDLLLPLGKGQRELVVGDRKTGKTSFVFSAMKSQIAQGALVVYAAIGKKSIEIEQIRHWVGREGISSSMTIVATTSQDAPSLIYYAPFTAMAIAEFFRDQGRDVLVVMDDLSTHAKYYREIALLAHQFPGRDSYPGDVFFTHARLLERAGNYMYGEGGEAAITCLPLAETQENDLTDYIVSNLIGITDGHIHFDTGEFIKGRRPAIHVSLSVTRVGKQTQKPLAQAVTRKLLAFLGQYHRSQNFSHFGSELTKSVQNLLQKGILLYEFFDQDPEEVIPIPVQMLFFCLIWQGHLETAHLKRLRDFRYCLTKTYNDDSHFRLLVDHCVGVDQYDDLLHNVDSLKNQLFQVCQLS